MLGAMGLQVIQGPPNSGRAGAVLAGFRAALAREPVLVVPTGDDVAEFERQLCAGGSAALGGSIRTFGALTAEIARSAAGGGGPALSPAQRQALIRAAIDRVAPRSLRRSAGRPGFAPAMARLIAELQAALVEPAEFAAAVAELADAGHETELARIYTAYVELREATGHADPGATAGAALEALRAEPQTWGDRPVYIYGFDDLTRAQLELVAGLARATEVTIAVTYADRKALAARAGLVSKLQHELGAELGEPLPFEEGYTQSAALRHLDRNLFESHPGRIEPDDGLSLMRSAGARGEAEAIGIECARLLRAGYEPDEIVVVTRRPDTSGPLLAEVLRELGVPVALEASATLSSTCVGTALDALCRAALDDGDVDALLAHMRCDPEMEASIVDGLERRIRRGSTQSVSGAIESWEKPPRHLARLREASDDAARLRALARSARELAESAHRERAPLAGSGDGSGVPFLALELRAGVAAAELLNELAGIGSLEGCEQPGLAEAIEALGSASVPHWRGPASGRVRILSPYRARAARARALFCCSLQDGEFPSASPLDPLLSEERRRDLGNPDLRRAEQADEERYLFHSCVSRPTERLYLSWQYCDEDGGALARSPFVDEVLDLIDVDPDRPGEQLLRSRGPEHAIPALSEATTPRALARAVAVSGPGTDRAALVERLDVGAAAAEALACFEGLPDPDALPGPLRAAPVLEDLRGREVFSANSLEGWVGCSYRWFVEHELEPQRLEPEADPLWLGSVVHDALERLYREPPGSDSIPRPGDVGRWRDRFGELLTEVAVGRTGAELNRARRAKLNRARVQIDAFLEQEAELETDFRPDRALLELAFGPFEDEHGVTTETHQALRFGDFALRGRIDRVDLAPDGHGAVVRDYKTGKNVATAREFARKGTLQIQLYMLAVRRVLGLEPIAGLYQPLGASDPGKRRARGLALADDPRTEALALVRTDRRPQEEFEQALDDAEARAAAAAARMRNGDITRDPLNGECPKYCTFQPICRLERALGVVGRENGGGDTGEDQ
jgi:ATP-dependent helicase/nuclease subunit B